jgi:hypothetical protein
VGKFHSDRISYIILRGRWCRIIVLNVHARTKYQAYITKCNVCDELEHLSYQLPKYGTNILLVDFSAYVSGEHTFKSTIWSESLHKISNGNKVRVADFATFKSLIVRSTRFPHRSVHKFTDVRSTSLRETGGGTHSYLPSNRSQERAKNR